MRNLMQEFLKKHDGVRYPSILGVREHIFTGRYFLTSLYAYNLIFCVLCLILTTSNFGSVSSLAWFMSNQETSFVTIGQRVLANPLR